MTKINSLILSGSILKYLVRTIAGMVGLIPVNVFASEAGHTGTHDLTTHTVGYISLAIFVLAYLLVAAEEYTHLRKAKPVIIGIDNSGTHDDVVPFDVFSRVSKSEWDTLLFFYGVVMCVGGLGYICYLIKAS